MKLVEVTEMVNTHDGNPPEGDDWEYDGHDCNVGSGQYSYFWTRKTGELDEIKYTTTDVPPKGDDWYLKYSTNYGKGCKLLKNRRYIWTRETNLKRRRSTRIQKNKI